MFVPLTDDDVPDVVALMNRAYRGGTASWNTEAAYISGSRTTADLLRAEVAGAPDAFFLICRDDAGGLQGCVWLEPLDDDAWYLRSLAVEPARQAGGLGSLLLGAAERWVAARGGRRVRMSVINVREALIAWYVRRGYEPTGETKPFPYGDDRFGTPLRDDLALVVLEKALTPA